MVNATTSQSQSGSVPDSSVSATPAFKDFAFRSIGKVPSLFTRLSSPGHTATYNPDEEEQDDDKEQQMDQPSAQDLPNPASAIRTRPSLTELFAKDQADSIQGSSSGDQSAPKPQTMFQFFQQQPLGQSTRAQTKTPIPIPTPSKPVPQCLPTSSAPSSIVSSTSALTNLQPSTSQVALPMSSDSDIHISDSAPSIPSHISLSSVPSSSPAKSSPLAPSQSTVSSISTSASTSTSTPVHAPPASALRAIHQSLSTAITQLKPFYVQAPIDHVKTLLELTRTQSSEALVLAQSSVTDAEAALKLAHRSFSTANACLAKATEADKTMAELVNAVEAFVEIIPDQVQHNKMVGEMRKVEERMGKWTSAHENAVEVTRKRKREAEMARLQQQKQLGDEASALKERTEAIRAAVRSQSDPGFNHPVDAPTQPQTQCTIQNAIVSDEAEAARLVLSQRQMEYLERKKKAEEELRKKKEEEDEAERVMREEEERVRVERERAEGEARRRREEYEARRRERERCEREERQRLEREREELEEMQRREEERVKAAEKERMMMKEDEERKRKVLARLAEEKKKREEEERGEREKEKEEEERRKKMQEEQEEKRRVILESKQRATEEAAERIRRQRQMQDVEKAKGKLASPDAPVADSSVPATPSAPVVTSTATKKTSPANNSKKPKARDSDGDHHVPPAPPAKRMKMSPPASTAGPKAAPTNQTKKNSNSGSPGPQIAQPGVTVSMQNAVAGLSASGVSSTGTTLPVIGSHVIVPVNTEGTVTDTLKQVQQLSQEMNQWKTAPPGIVTSGSATSGLDSTLGLGLTATLGLGLTSTSTSANMANHSAMSEPNLRSIKAELVDHVSCTQHSSVGVGAGAKGQSQPQPQQHTSSSVLTTSAKRNASGRVSPATSVLVNAREGQLTSVSGAAVVGAGSPTSGLGSTKTTTTATTPVNGPKTQGKKKKGGSKDFSASSSTSSNVNGGGKNSPQGASSNKTLPGPTSSTSANPSIPTPNIAPAKPNRIVKNPHPKITVPTPPTHPLPPIPPLPFVPVSSSAVSVGSTSEHQAQAKVIISTGANGKTNSAASSQLPPTSPRTKKLGGVAPSVRLDAYSSSGHTNANANAGTNPTSSLSDILGREVQSDVLPGISNDNSNGRRNGASRAASGNFDTLPSSLGARYPPNGDHYSPSPPALSANRASTSFGSSYVPNSGSGAIRPSTSNDSIGSNAGNTRRTRARAQLPARQIDHYSPPSLYQPLSRSQSRSRSRSRSKSPQLRYPVNGYQASLPLRRASPDPVRRPVPVYDTWPLRPRSPSPSPAPPPARPWLPSSDRDRDLDRGYEYERPGSPKLGDKRRVSHQYEADDGYPAERGRRGRFESPTLPPALPTMLNGDSYRPSQQQQQPQMQRARYPSRSRSPVRREPVPVRAPVSVNAGSSGATINGRPPSTGGNSVSLAQRFKIPPAQGMIHDASSSSSSLSGGVTPSSSAGNLNMEDTGDVRSLGAGGKSSMDLLNRITDPGQPSIHAGNYHGNGNGSGYKNYHQNQHQHQNRDHHPNHHSNQQRNHHASPYARRQASASSGGVALEQRISKPSLAERVR